MNGVLSEERKRAPSKLQHLIKYREKVIRLWRDGVWWDWPIQHVILSHQKITNKRLANIMGGQTKREPGGKNPGNSRRWGESGLGILFNKKNPELRTEIFG